MNSDDIVDPAVDILARLAALEHAAAAQWHVFAMNRANTLGMTAAAVSSNFKEAVCGALLDVRSDIPAHLLDRVRLHTHALMDHALAMSRLDDRLSGRLERSDVAGPQN